jgi:hypothetical protein
MKSTKVIDAAGNISWLNNSNKLHREDGPAIECTDGYKEWWVNGERYSEESFLRTISTGYSNIISSIIDIDTKEIKIDEHTHVKIDGELYKLVKANKII